MLERASATDDPNGRRALATSVVSQTLVLLPFAIGWMRMAPRAFPAGTVLVDPTDGALITSVLGWVAGALASSPGALFDAPVNHPAPLQLTGTDPLLSSQLIFLPIYSITHSAPLAANLVALLSYPLAAVAMERLLRALGCSTGASWAGGLAFALGPLRVPGNLQLIQYQNWYLPWLALTLTRLRARPTLPRAVVCGAAFLLGALSSYYLAVMLGVLAALWIGFEMRGEASAAKRSRALAVQWLAAALVILGAVSVPYFASREARGDAEGLDIARLYREHRDIPGVEALGDHVLTGFRYTGPESLRTPDFALRVASGVFRVLIVGWFGAVPLGLAALGLLALGSDSMTARTVARRGLMVTAIAIPLALLPVDLLAGHPADSWLGILVTAPLRLFRLPYRFVVLAGFGTALLTAAAIHAAGVRGGARSGWAAALVAATALLVTRGPLLSGMGATPLEEPDAYLRLRELAAGSAGEPLLELPLSDPQGHSYERAAMIGTLLHRLPLISGQTGYAPQHRPLLDQAVAALPSPSALERLVDLTHLRWLLLRPVSSWSDASVRAGILSLAEVSVVAETDGWTIAHIDRSPRHPEWYAAIARGEVPDPPPPDLDVAEARHR